MTYAAPGRRFQLPSGRCVEVLRQKKTQQDALWECGYLTGGGEVVPVGHAERGRVGLSDEFLRKHARAL